MVAVFIDLKKAFETICRESFIQKWRMIDVGDMYWNGLNAIWFHENR